MWRLTVPTDCARVATDGGCVVTDGGRMVTGSHAAIDGGRVGSVLTLALSAPVI